MVDITKPAVLPVECGQCFGIKHWGDFDDGRPTTCTCHIAEHATHLRALLHRLERIPIEGRPGEDRRRILAERSALRYAINQLQQ